MWLPLGFIKVVTPGTPVRITSLQTDPGHQFLCHAIQLQQVPGQGGIIIIGRHDMEYSPPTIENCLAFLAKPTDNLLQAASAGIPNSGNALDARDYWIDATVAGEGALVSYLEL